MSEYLHAELASGRWEQMSLAQQMGNIGSEISRAIRWKSKNNPERMNGALDRALELIDLSIRWAQKAESRIAHPGHSVSCAACGKWSAISFSMKMNIRPMLKAFCSILIGLPYQTTGHKNGN